MSKITVLKSDNDVPTIKFSEVCELLEIMQKECDSIPRDNCGYHHTWSGYDWAFDTVKKFFFKKHEGNLED